MAPTKTIDNVSQEQNHRLRIQNLDKDKELSNALRYKRKVLNSGVDSEENDELIKRRRVNRIQGKFYNSDLNEVVADFENNKNGLKNEWLKMWETKILAIENKLNFLDTNFKYLEDEITQLRSDLSRLYQITKYRKVEAEINIKRQSLLLDEGKLSKNPLLIDHQGTASIPKSNRNENNKVNKSNLKRKINCPKFDGNDDYDIWEEAVKKCLLSYKQYSEKEKIRWVKSNMTGLARQVVYKINFAKLSKLFKFLRDMFSDKLRKIILILNQKNDETIKSYKVRVISECMDITKNKRILNEICLKTFLNGVRIDIRKKLEIIKPDSFRKAVKLAMEYEESTQSIWGTF